MSHEPELDHLETLLRRLPLRRPGRDLVRRILGGPASQRVWRPALALAACTGLVCFLLGYQASRVGNGARRAEPGPPVVAEARGAADERAVPFEPERIDLLWRQVVPEGTYVVDSGPPVLRFRRRQIGRTLWIESRRNITVEMDRPSEGVILVRDEPF